MKKIIPFFCLFIFFSSHLTQAQAPNWLWAESGAGAEYGYCSGLAIDSTGNLFIAGRVNSSLAIGGLTVTASGTVPFVGKLDSSGKAKWLSSNYQYSGFSYPYGFCIDNKDNSYVTGSDGSGAGVFIQKFNSSGTLVWDTLSKGSGTGIGYGVAADKGDDIYATGTYTSGITFGNTTLPAGNNGGSGFLAKTDSNGNFKWATYFSSTSLTSSYYTSGRGVVTDDSGNVYVSGSFEDTTTFYSANSASTITVWANPLNGNLFIAKYDSTGNLKRVTYATNAGVSADYFGSLIPITIDPKNNIYVAGMFEDTALFDSGDSVISTRGTDVFIAKYDNSGVLQWVQSGGGTDDGAYATAIALDKNYNVYVTGIYNSSATFGSTTLDSGNIFVVKYGGNDGSFQWVQSGSILFGSPSGIAVNNQNFVFLDGSYYGGGTLGSITLPAAPQGSIFVTELDSGIVSGIPQLSVNNNHLSIYPNPSSGEINIVSTKIIDDLKVTDLLGQLVYESQPKQTQFTFELNDEGMYFVTVTAGNEISTSKIIVSK